jgi:hypothetical protein
MAPCLEVHDERFFSPARALRDPRRVAPRPHLYRNETPAPPREHFTWPDPLDIHPATYDSGYR